MIRTVTFIIIGILVAGVGYYFFDKKQKQSAWWVGECEREELAGRVKLLELRLSSKEAVSAKKSSADDFLGKKEAAARLAELGGRKEELEQTISAIASVWQALDAERIRVARENAVGATWEEIVFKDRTYYDAKVVLIEDAGVTLAHRHGLAKLRISDLDEEQRDFFGLDEESSRLAMKRELQNAANYHMWVDETARQIARDRYLDELLRTRIEAKPNKKSPARQMVAANAPEQKGGMPQLKITSLLAPPRKLDTSRRVYRSGRTVNYYGAPYVPPASETNQTGAP